jgi:hypothetical protein
MRTTFKTAALLIAAFSIPQLANAGIIWDMTGMGKSLAESKLRGQGAEESHLTNSDNGPSDSQSNSNENNNGDYGNLYANGNKNDNNADETVVIYEQFTVPFVPVVPVETVTELEPVSVPEPMSLVLFATGLLAAAAFARRKSA